MVFPRSWNQATALRKTSAIISLGLVLLGFDVGEMGGGRRARCVGQKVLIKGRWWVFMANPSPGRGQRLALESLLASTWCRPPLSNLAEFLGVYVELFRVSDAPR